MEQELIIPEGSRVGDRFYVPFQSAPNDALDMGNTIHLRLCPGEEGSEGSGDLDNFEDVPYAMVFVSDDDCKC